MSAQSGLNCRLPALGSAALSFQIPLFFPQVVTWTKTKMALYELLCLQSSYREGEEDPLSTLF